MTITAAATRTVPLLRLTITPSSLPLSLFPRRAAHQGTLPAKESSATLGQPVRLCVPSNRSMSPIIARRSHRFEFRSSKLRAQRCCYGRVGEEGACLAHSTNSELHLAYVFPTAVHRPFPNPITSRPREMLEDELEEAMQQAQHFLDQQVDRVKEEGVSVAEAHLIRGEPDKEVVHLSEEIGAGLIIMGSRGLGGIRRALMGSVSDSVVRHAHCPVLIVRE